MNSYLIISFAISIILGIVGLLASNNLIVTIVVVAISIIYFLFLDKPIVNKFQIKVQRFKECYHFINTFVVSLSIKENLAGAYESAISAMPDDFNEKQGNIDSFDIKEKLEHIGKYFHFHVYRLFLDLINIWSEQGGDILNMSHYLINETRVIEEYINKSIMINKKRIVEFVILWLLTLGIMSFLRFVLAQFYQTLVTQLFYPIGVGVILLFALFSIYLAMKKMFFIEIKGWDDHEQI